MIGDIWDGLTSKFGQLLPNGNLAIPFELVTVYNAVTDVWEALPLAVRMSFIGVFGMVTLFVILRMLF